MNSAGIGINGIFWFWLFYDEIFETKGDCPLDNPDIHKMKKEGIKREETRPQ